MLPLTTPHIFILCPVAYKSIFTSPARHWVTFTNIFPSWDACRTRSRNHSFEGAFPAPYVSMITALVSDPSSTSRTTDGVMPGCIFKMLTLVSSSVCTTSGETGRGRSILSLYLMFMPATARGSRLGDEKASKLSEFTLVLRFPRRSFEPK